MQTCANCGFLAMRDRATHALVETEPDFRERGLPTGWDMPTPIADSNFPRPLCFAREIDFLDEMERLTGRKIGKPSGSEIKPVLNAPRDDCPSWVQWKQGFTPKEHREMLDREWMLDRERRWRREDRRARKEEIALAKAAADATKATARWQALSVVVASVAIAVGVLVTVFGDDPPVVNNYPIVEVTAAADQP